MDQEGADGEIWSQLRCWKPNRNGWSRLGLWNSKGLSYQLCWGTLTFTLCPQSPKGYLAPHLKDWPTTAPHVSQLQSSKIPLHLLKKEQLWYTQLHHYRQKADILDRLSDFEKKDVASGNPCRIALSLSQSHFRDNHDHSILLGIIYLQQSSNRSTSSTHKFALIQETNSTLLKAAKDV